MKDSYEQRIQNQFGGFCVKVLKNEAGCIRREYARLRDREKSLDDLNASELEQTATVDKYFMGEHVFEVLGLPIVVTGDLLAEAIAQLPRDKRDVILLSYFVGMNDRESSERLNVVRQTISKRRLTTLRELRKYLMKWDLNDRTSKAYPCASDPGSHKWRRKSTRRCGRPLSGLHTGTCHEAAERCLWE